MRKVEAGRPGAEAIFEGVFDAAERARTRAPLSRADAEFVRDTVPAALGSIHRVRVPKSIRHPAGFTVTGAPVGTFLKSALLIAGQRALGRRFAAHPFFEEVERDLAFGVMRSHFHLGYPKGTYCCAQCTLAVYPVIQAGAIRYFACGPLARQVEELIRKRRWRFAGSINPAMLRWAFGERK